MRNQTDLKLKKELHVLLLFCILTGLGIHWISSQGVSDSYYLEGDVIAVEDDSFVLSALPDQSKLEVNIRLDPYHFNLDDFSSKTARPNVGDHARITCSPDLDVLIGLYIKAENGDWRVPLQEP